MTHFNSIKELIINYKNLPYPGGIYTEAAKKEDYTSSNFWVLSNDEEMDQEFIETEYDEIPECLVKYNAMSFLDVGTFQAIIDNKLEHNKDLSICNTDILIKAIQYYLEEDDFQD